MSSARLLRLAGLVSAADGLLVVTQLVGALAFVVVDGDPTRRARSALVGVNGLLTLLAVYLLLLGLVGLYARQAAASGTLGLAGFLVAFVGSMLLAGAWWLETFAVQYGAVKVPVLVAEPPTGTAAGRCGRVVRHLRRGLGAVRYRQRASAVFPRDAALPLVSAGHRRADRRRSRRRCAAGAGGGVDGHLAAPVGSWRPSRAVPSR
jgi:hypothetical protein